MNRISSILSVSAILLCVFAASANPTQTTVLTGMQYDSRFVTCDDFNRPDSTTVDGWTEQSGDWAISSNALASPSGTHTYITYDGSTMSGDFCVTVQVSYAASAGVQLGAAMGWFSDLNTHLMFKVQDNTSAGYFDSFGLYQNNTGLFNTGLNFGTNPIIQLEVAGTTATGRVDTDGDGTFDYEYTSTISVSSGLCGIVHYGNAHSMDDWCYGDECGSGVPTHTPTPTTEPCNNDGDVSLDGELTAVDAQTAFLIALGIYMPFFEEVCAADCDGNSEVTAGDAQAIFLAVLGSGSCMDPL